MQNQIPPEESKNKTHFGFQTVDEDQKAQKVADVFHSVAKRYDIMNDFMSVGLHRAWKFFTIGKANVLPGMKVLDVAAGSGDLTIAFAKKVGTTGEVWHTDINYSMLSVGRDRLIDKGFNIPSIVCDAEKLPFKDNYFDVVTVAFGLRNMTHKDKAIAEMYRVIRPGGKLLILEFSKIYQPLEKVYDWYSFNILPWLGKNVAKDEDSYRYLAESIRMHPDQETLAQMMRDVGFERVDYHNLSMGIVALHEGIKL
ncbi:ubiquinone/menaquinone biosynthesis methyltransferase [Taylorella equigenitalis 14/56]|uniref:Ubiquinone/menaquinone biosynthesis C-methyltransferase UbiE n=1 Tax=Taylorella equigenitalis 14/56 TaxID=1091497 RepID=I7IBB8_9BURK|nr:bifunctional demethylmenaquinone methyltransferase/2-methoxy-6-polyprenyl-1,4-benzoquinol methylase UbiE [Taylorella equigenitalis]ASY30024.1 bifunctional demethylmenaquinone methyltransferase/2-methoxy-6-polyprenyl-1,4-benzoquinol methylase [Taylorella equigenitalis]ASY37329.1 bifunctional demethylmenaquinone methyltransferase/2-methoxy-6-polyprenyl-1,4-benzoquinol methylase UbiE [Taylorella equigenitalis]ASY41752.1 bifunctional demethylmenaquinone methyltransferase/2-methoxy-6-polyprenyl-1,